MDFCMRSDMYLQLDICEKSLMIFVHNIEILGMYRECAVTVCVI